jgi:hypothetical protein
MATEPKPRITKVRPHAVQGQIWLIHAGYFGRRFGHWQDVFYAQIHPRKVLEYIQDNYWR